MAKAIKAQKFSKKTLDFLVKAGKQKNPKWLEKNMEEYELVLHWAEDLRLDKNFELVNEKEFRTKRTNIDELLSSIEKDPYDLEYL